MKKLCAVSIILLILLIPLVMAATETLRPNAAGDNSENTAVGDTPNYKCVDEASSDSDTTYVKSPSTDSNQRLDLYNIEPTSIPVGSTINSVTVYARCRSVSNTYKATFDIALKRSGHAVEYGSSNQPTTTYTLYNSVFTTVAQTELDNLQIGVRIESGDHDPIFYSGRCTQVYAIIDYTEGQQGTALECNGTSTLTFNSDSTRAYTFTLDNTAALTYTVEATQSLSHFLSFLGSTVLDFATSTIQSFNVVFQKTVTLNYASNRILAYAFPLSGTSTLNLDASGLFALTLGHTLDLKGSTILTLQTLIFSSDSSDLLWLAFGGILGVVMGFVGTLFVFRSREDD